MTNSKRKIGLPDRPAPASAPDPHDPAATRAHHFPFSMSDRIKIGLSEEGFGKPGQVGQRLGIHFAEHDPPGLLAGGIKREGILNFNALREQICFQLALHHRLPLPSCHRHRHSHHQDGDHQHDVGEAAFALVT